MTDDNKKVAIATDVERGAGALRSAKILLREGELADAVSRAYYAVFHHTRALLLMSDAEARTHRGVGRLLYSELVRQGTFPPDVARLFGELQRFRQDADYSAEFVFTVAHATEEIEHAERFVDEVVGILRREKWLDPAP